MKPIQLHLIVESTLTRVVLLMCLFLCTFVLVETWSAWCFGLCDTS